MSWIKNLFSKSESVVLEKNEPSLTLEEIAKKSSPMSREKASKIEAYYSCIKDVADTIGQLPLVLYRTEKDGKRVKITDNRLNRIFTKRPNEFMRMSDLIRMIVVSLKSNGVFYAYKVRNDRGNVMELIPFFNQRNIHAAHDVNGNVYYNYVYNDGRIGDPFRTDDLLIIKGFTFDGYTAVSPIAQMATILGIADAQEEGYKELQTNGITSQMALATDGKFNDDKSIKRLKEQWDTYRGVAGRKNIPVLEDGLKPINLKLTPQEAELISHREFSVKRIASALGVPLYRINMYEGSITKGLLPELDESYMRNNLNPILVQIEEMLNEILPDNVTIQFNRKAYYAGSPWRLVEHVSKEVSSGLATINEGRADLGRELDPDGDIYVINSNNHTFGRWNELPDIREQINGRAVSNTQEGNDNAD